VSRPRRHQAEPALLRPATVERARREVPAEVLGEDRTLTHREDAGLRPRIRQGRDVARGEDAIVRKRAERRVNAHEAAVVEREAASLQPRRRRGARGPDDDVEVDPRAGAAGRDGDVMGGAAARRRRRTRSGIPGAICGPRSTRATSAPRPART
jgi:hypothetical protein